jgi:hypothetical protein
MTAEWLLLAIGLLMVTHLVVLAYVMGRDSRRSTAATDGETEYRTGEMVDCPHCGETNEPEYRFCRQCVSELPTGGSVLQTRAGPRGRRTL